MDGLELRLPPNLQNALEVSAAAHERSVEDEAKALLEAALGAGPARDEVVNGTQLEQLAVLNETQLWRLARQQVPTEKSERMQVLTERSQAEGLSPQETKARGSLHSTLKLNVSSLSFILVKNGGRSTSNGTTKGS